MKEEDVAVCKRLKELRKERGLTLNSLAEKIGSDYQQISRIERGKSKLTIDTLMKMADALETPLTDIVHSKPEGETKIVSLPVTVKNEVHPPKEVPHCNPQDMLAKILVKLEIIQQENKVNLQPQTKAAFAALVYKQILQTPSLEHNSQLLLEFMDGWIDMMRILISDLKNQLAP